jgi:hypothetical protein
VAAAVAAASGAASVRVWHITSRGWDPWTERPLPEVVRVAYPLTIVAVLNVRLMSPSLFRSVFATKTIIERCAKRHH